MVLGYIKAGNKYTQDSNNTFFTTAALRSLSNLAAENG
jgi:hypothetical protein